MIQDKLRKENEKLIESLFSFPEFNGEQYNEL